MSELFKNAKFGDKFRTRDGRCAIYDFYDNDEQYGHQLLLDRFGIAYYNDDGKWHRDREDAFDIVSRWEEPLDENQIEDIVKSFWSDDLEMFENNPQRKDILWCVERIYRNGIINGYKIAKQE